MRDLGYINPNLHQMGMKPQLRKRLKNAITPSRILPSHATIQAAQPIKCPNSSSWFDLKKHPMQQQLQASLFELPLEIRLLIYNEVIDAWTGGSVEGYHVVEARYLTGCQKNTGLTIVPCDCPSSGTNKEETAAGWAIAINLFADWNPRSSSSSNFHWWTRHNVNHAPSFCCSRTSESGRLGLFLTCRRIYSEAIGLLYSSHNFDLTGLYTAHSFLSTVSPHCLDMIRFLTLNSIEVPPYYTKSWTSPHTPRKEFKELQKVHRLGEEEWLHSCRLIQSMRRLKSLRIKIDDCSFILETLFLKPLMDIWLKDGNFMIEVPDCFRVGKLLAKHISGKDGTIPFSIERGSPPLNPLVENVEKGGGLNFHRNRSLTLLNVLCCPIKVVVRGVPIVASLLKSKGEKKIEYYKECYRKGARSR